MPKRKAKIPSHIPRNTNRHHPAGGGNDEWLGDNQKAIRDASVGPIGADGGWFIDQNQQICLADPDPEFPVDEYGEHDCATLHWETARKNGYLYILVKKAGVWIRVKMTNEQLDRHVSEWKASEIKRWRRTRIAGPSFKSRNRPFMFSELVVYSKQWGVIICPELKSEAFGSAPKLAKRMKKYVDDVKWVAYPMTLIVMKGWSNKLKVFHAAGFEVALLSHGQPKPKNWNTVKNNIDAVWPASYWLD